MEKVSKEERIKWLVDNLPELSEGQIIWIERIAYQFTRPKTFLRLEISDIIINESILEDFGDALRIHHCFSDEPFTKDKFEYALVNVCSYHGLESKKRQNNNPGEDVIINSQRYSLKTQADKNLRIGSINIHKYMELGRGEWTNKPKQLKDLTDQFIHHLGNYEKIIMLRNIGRPTPGVPYWKYELVEIPKSLLLEAGNGVYEMMTDSIQTPKPGYCRVFDSETKELKFELYFDGGTERKLKINKIDKRACIVHATWEFIVKELDENLNQEKGSESA